MSRRRTNLIVPVSNYDVTAVIDQGCEFEGKLCFQGTVRINGTFRGEIYTPDTLIIGENARIQGEIEAGIVVMCGEVIGTIRAKHRVEIHQPAVFRGDIFTPSLSVQEGVIFEGSSNMAQTSSQKAQRPKVEPIAFNTNS